MDYDLPFSLSCVPDLAAAGEAFQRLCATIAALRDPEHGCPWDLQQTHRSLRAYMLEEAYEACEAMGGDHADQLCDELGDVLLQVLLNAQIALSEQSFSVVDLIEKLNKKMRRRHPHVFGNLEQRSRKEMTEIKESWQVIKKQERQDEAEKTPAKKQSASYFQQEKVTKVRPATTQALKIGKIAARLDFDWANADETFLKFRSEVDELAEELELEVGKRHKDRIEDEVGDLYFTLAQLCRHLGLDPEVSAQHGNQKFLKRFALVEALAQQKGLELTELQQADFEILWSEAKKQK